MIWRGGDVAICVKNSERTEIVEDGVKMKPSQIHTIPDYSEITIREGESLALASFDDIEQENGFYELPKGTYRVKLANEVEIPYWAVGYITPVSELSEMGIIKAEDTFLKSGYEGKPEVTILIPFRHLKLSKDMFSFKLMFMSLDEERHDFNTPE